MYTDNADWNFKKALDAGRLDHAKVWATLVGLLGESLPEYDSGKDVRMEREIWARGVRRRKVILDDM